MTGTSAQKREGFFSLSRLGGRKTLAAVFLAMFFLGYNLTTSSVQQCSAQLPPNSPPSVSGGTCVCCFITCWDECVPVTNTDTCSGGVCSADGSRTCSTDADCSWGGTSCTQVCSTCPPPDQCDGPGTADALINALIANFVNGLDQAATDLEEFMMNVSFPPTIQVLWLQVDSLEQDMKWWWKTMWSYNLLPSLQSMARQLNVDRTWRLLMLHATADATGELEVKLALEKHGMEDWNNLTPGPQVCVAATASGGFGRASNFSRAMRLAWEDDSVARGLNRYGRSDSAGLGDSEGQRVKEYERLFCNPDSNGGNNKCNPAWNYPELYDADVQPTQRIFSKLTLDLNEGAITGNQAFNGKTVETIINNMVGVPSTESFLPGVLTTPQGQEAFLARRSYLARYAVARTVPQMVASWRLPGSRMDKWVSDLREAAGIPLVDATGKRVISDNPSYKEVIHAISIDRFNSGRYASEMMAEESKIEMEKLTLNAFYLMQLRDYYELLERTALTLAVQVSMMSEQARQSGVTMAVPVK